MGESCLQEGLPHRVGFFGASAGPFQGGCLLPPQSPPHAFPKDILDLSARKRANQQAGGHLRQKKWFSHASLRSCSVCALPHQPQSSEEGCTRAGVPEARFQRPHFLTHSVHFDEVSLGSYWSMALQKQKHPHLIPPKVTCMGSEVKWECRANRRWGTEFPDPCEQASQRTLRRPDAGAKVTPQLWMLSWGFISPSFLPKKLVLYSTLHRCSGGQPAEVSLTHPRSLTGFLLEHCFPTQRKQTQR